LDKNNREYNYIIPEIKNWPIFTLSRDRQEFIEKLTDYTVNRIKKTAKDKLSEDLAKVIYQERTRVKENPWKVDPPHEIDFWNRLRKKLVKRSLDVEEAEADADKNNEEILRTIVNRYSEEIAGNFKISTYKFARKFLTAGLNRLLNTASNRNFRRFYSARYKLRERLILHGDIDLLRSVGKDSTMVIVPTHYSNLDSVMLGWAIDSIGLPAVSYGAGLNLFNNPLMAYYFNRLGAYKLDRRKKNSIYLDTLKSFSTLTIERGTNSLFFPGGTRERTGQIEKKLKMGLLGTVTEAQRSLYEDGTNKKVVVVPLVIGYNFVLEAESLINDHLKREGKELYISESDNFSFLKTIHFLWKFFAGSSEIQISFGKPIDVLGNFVDKNSNSIDERGNIIDLKEYFISNGTVSENLQRDMEYTKILADKIVDRFHVENIVLSSHLVAFTAFNIIKSSNSNKDLFRLMRIPDEETLIEKEVLEAAVIDVLKILNTLKDEGKLQLSVTVSHGNVKKIIDLGINNMEIYHAFAPLQRNENGHYISPNLKLLYYYHNRMLGYSVEENIRWANYQILETPEKPIAQPTT